MTQQMQRLLARVDGLPPTIAPISAIAPLPLEPEARSRPTASGRPLQRKRSCPRADWMSGRVPPEIERLALEEELTEIRSELAAAGLM